jgi:uncharacterized membrane protein YeaQ/YmgE (transglycosylase-associated protein family)
MSDILRFFTPLFALVLSGAGVFVIMYTWELCSRCIKKDVNPGGALSFGLFGMSSIFSAQGLINSLINETYTSYTLYFFIFTLVGAIILFFITLKQY